MRAPHGALRATIIVAAGPVKRPGTWRGRGNPPRVPLDKRGEGGTLPGCPSIREGQGGRMRWLVLPVLAGVLIGCHTAARSPEAPATLADLVRDYDREITTYFPFTASDMGQHEYDRVLANDIG